MEWRYVRQFLIILVPASFIGAILKFVFEINAGYVAFPGFLLAYLLSSYNADTDSRTAQKESEEEIKVEFPKVMSNMGMIQCTKDMPHRKVINNMSVFDISGHAAIIPRKIRYSNAYFKPHKHIDIFIYNYEFVDRRGIDDAERSLKSTIILFQSLSLSLPRFSIHPKNSNSDFLWDQVSINKSMKTLKGREKIFSNHVVRVKHGHEQKLNLILTTNLSDFTSLHPGINIEGNSKDLVIFTEDKKMIDERLNHQYWHNAVIKPMYFSSFFRNALEAYNLFSSKKIGAV